MNILLLEHRLMKNVGFLVTKVGKEEWILKNIVAFLFTYFRSCLVLTFIK